MVNCRAASVTSIGSRSGRINLEKRLAGSPQCEERTGYPIVGVLNCLFKDRESRVSLNSLELSFVKLLGKAMYLIISEQGISKGNRMVE
ncbi:hypothetical protein CEXT_332831 [Caerostris extrusa]|uniref:Uncharacterized protein n=1 Tax=Caerostris extrusa TaxID=172846 RepID=A0AAV4VXZ5_CAEEX|nr:hypothetical protein CEXT_332831 [Caerostris extrusa]